MTKKAVAEKKALAEEFYAAATADNFTSLAYQYADKDHKDYYDVNSETYSDSYTTATNVNYSSLETYFGEDIAKWAFEDGRQVGDKTMSTQTSDDGSTTFIIAIMSSLPSRDETLQPVAVRHILFSLTKDVEKTDEDGNTTTEQEAIRTKDEALAEAQKTLDAWVKTGAKEDDFIKLAAEKSEDPGSADNGGLYEDITTTSSYVKEFLDWCFADGRKVGDYGVISTEYGAHIMYMSSISDKPQWKQDVISAVASSRTDEFYQGIVTDKGFNGKLSNGLIKTVQNKIEKYAEKVVANYQAQLEASATTSTTAAAK